MDKYVPKDIGNLRDIVDKGVDYITYESPYAHAQYIGEVHGSPVRNYTTPGTGSYWDKKMVSAIILHQVLVHIGTKKWLVQK